MLETLGTLARGREERCREFPNSCLRRSFSALNAVGAQRREAVKADRGVACGIGPGRQDLDLVADFEAQRQPVFGPLIEDVGAVAGGPGDNHRSEEHTSELQSPYVIS